MKNNNAKPIYLYDLKAAYRTYIESQLASYVLRKHPKLAAVKKIAKRILYLIDNNNTSLKQGEPSPLLKSIINAPKFIDELYNDHMFGRLGNKPPAPEQIIEAIRKILLDYSADHHTQVKLEQVMHIISAFAYRIYNELPDKQIKPDSPEQEDAIGDLTLSETIDYLTKKFPDSQVSLLKSVEKDFKEIHKNSDRGRAANVDENAPCKQTLGNCRNGFFTKHLSNSTYASTEQAHRPAMAIYQPDNNSLYYQATRAKNLPYIAGRSTHTLTFMKAATWFGNLTHSEMQYYFIAAMSYLVGGGNHTFDECAAVGHLVSNIPYKEGDYQASLPADIVTGLKHTLAALTQKYSSVLFLTEQFFTPDPANQLLPTSAYYKELLTKYLTLDKAIVASHANFNKQTKENERQYTESPKAILKAFHF